MGRTMGEGPDKPKRVPFRSGPAGPVAPPVSVAPRTSASLSAPDAVLAAAADAGLIIFNWSPDGGLDGINLAGLELLQHPSSSL